MPWPIFALESFCPWSADLGWWENTQNQRFSRKMPFFLPFCFFFPSMMDICHVRWSLFLFFFLSFGNEGFEKKNAGQTFLARGSKVFFPLLGWDFRQPKTSEVLLADAVFGHSHFCDASETWIFHWHFAVFRRPAGLVEDLTTFLVSKLFFAATTGGRFDRQFDGCGLCLTVTSSNKLLFWRWPVDQEKPMGFPRMMLCTLATVLSPMLLAPYLLQLPGHQF